MKTKTLLGLAVIGMIASGTFAGAYVGGNGNVGSMAPPTYTFAENDPNTWDNSQIAFVGFNNTVGTATFTIDGGTHFLTTPNSLTIGEGAGVAGEMTVTGAGSKYEVFNQALTVGSYMASSGTGTLNVLDSAYVYSTTLSIGINGSGIANVSGGAELIGGSEMTVGDTSSSAQVYVSGAGTVSGGGSVVVGKDVSGSALIQVTDNALFRASSLVLDDADNGNSFVNIQSGGKLALFDSSGNIDTMAELMAAIGGEDDTIRIWNGDSYELYTNLTEDVDYSVYQGTGDLSGYAVLTTGAVVPEPATMSLLALGGLSLLRRRKK